MTEERHEIDLAQCQLLNKMYKNDLIMFLKSIKEGGNEESEEVYQHSNIKLSDFLTVLAEIFANKDFDNLSQKGNSRMIPAGSVIAFAGRYKELPGYFFCDGATVSRTVYSNLFNAIGVAYGQGNGISTFNLPDFRGMFLRGAGGDAAQVGIKQGDAIRNITGGWTNYREEPTNAHGVFYVKSSWGNGVDGSRGTNDVVEFDASRVVPTANENRSVNFAVYYYIKY